jgi:hypothetical protein
MRRIVIAGVLVILVAGAAAWYFRPEFRDAIAALLGRSTDLQIDPSKGKFKGKLAVEFSSSTSGDGHPVEIIFLLEPFSYIDSRGVEWNVPAGFISDGASIPNYLWAILGGPYSGPYRDASVIHDYYCRTRTRPWQHVHLVFLEAALHRGTGKSLAQTMYAGILLDGPRWDDVQKADTLSRGVRKAQLVPTQSTTQPPAGTRKTDREIFEELKAWIEREKPTLEEIRKRVEEIRKAQKK